MKTFTLSAEVTVTVRRTVRARTKSEALEKANEDGPEILPMFNGVGDDITRPELIGLSEEQMWFDSDSVEQSLEFK